MKKPDQTNPKAGALPRREFLKNAALGAAAVAWLSPSSAAADEPVPSAMAGVSSGQGVAPTLFGYAASNWGLETSLIWFPDGKPYFETPRNAWVYFRKRFELSGQPAKAELKIFVDGRYRLFINGEYVLRGPVRSDPRWQYYDVLDVAGRLRPGKNVIAVQVLYYGYGTGSYQPRLTCLAAELEISGGTAVPTQTIRTDRSWNTRVCDAYDPNAPRVNGCQGAIEIFDARKDVSGWMELDFDDTSWFPAKTSPMGHWQTPYYRLLPRDIPLLAETEITARQISSTVAVKAFAEESFLPVRVRQELDQIHQEWNFASVPSQGVDVAATPGDQVSIMTVDFGRVEAGYLQMDVTAPTDTVIDVVYAEVLWEGRAIFDPAAQRPMDSFILAEGRNQLEVALGWKGFRYVQLLVRNPNGPVQLHRIGMRTRHYPLKVEGTVQTPDSFQQNLLQVCARTVEICMQDAFVDLSREQQQWMGDGRWHAVYNYYLGGDPRMHRKLLAQIAQSQDAEGLTKARYPDGHEHWAPIPAFCLMWVASFLDYYKFTGSLEPASDWWPNILLALRWFSRFENRAGLLEDVPHWRYIDLGESSSGPGPDVERGGIVTAMNLLYLEALQATAQLAEAMEDRDTRKHCLKKSAALGAAIASWLWSDAHGAYVDCVVDGKPSGVISDLTNALAAVHLEKTGSSRSKQLQRLLTGQTRHRVVYSSPFFLPVVIRALIKMNRTDYAWQIVQQRYRPILAAGSTTTWEHWNLFQNDADGTVSVNSATHAWGAGPLVLFFEGFAGVQLLKPGFKKFALAPQLGDFAELTFAVPTPAGTIRGRYARRPDGLTAEFTVPPGAIAVVDGRNFSAGKHRVEISN